MNLSDSTDDLTVTGNDGSDYIVTGSGDDYITTGGGGRNYISTGAGDDTVIGGDAYDSMRGSLGAGHLGWRR